MKLDQAAFQEALDDERLALGVRFDPHKHPRDLLGRWREVAASKGITFTETGDAVGPEYHGTIFAKKGDKHVGYLSYSYYDGEAQVNMVEIPEEHRREGIATILAGKLKEDTDAVLTPSMFIDEKGEKWWKSMGLEDEFDEFPEWSAPTPMKLEGYHGETEGKIEGGFNTPALFIGIDSKYGKHNSGAGVGRELAESYAAGDEPGAVWRVELDAQAVLDLDTGEKLEWFYDQVRGRDAGSFTQVKKNAFQWARSMGYDAIRIDWSGDDELGYEMGAGLWGEPQAIILDPGAALMDPVERDVPPGAVPEVNADRRRVVINEMQKKDTHPDPERRDTLQEYVDEADLSIRVYASQLGAILDSGKFKNIHEAETSNGIYDPKGREGQELKWWGAHPVYGYMAPPDEVEIGGPGDVALAAYGDVKVVLRDGVKDRATVTDGDSLMSPWAYPSPAREIDEVTTASTGDPLEFGREYAFGQQGANYVEAQIFGEVTTDQIRTVIFGTGAPDAELEKKLDDAGINWSVDPDWRSNAQDSADDYTSYDAGGLRPFEEADQELLAIRFNPLLHPRGPLGRFRDTLDRFIPAGYEQYEADKKSDLAHENYLPERSDLSTPQSAVADNYGSPKMYAAFQVAMRDPQGLPKYLETRYADGGWMWKADGSEWAFEADELEEVAAEVIRQSYWLDDAIEEHGRIPPPLFRYTGMDHFSQEQLDALDAGETIEHIEPGFLSADEQQETAYNISKETAGDRSTVLWRIKPHTAVAMSTRDATMSTSAINEWVFQPNTRLQIRKLEGPAEIYEVEALPSPAEAPISPILSESEAREWLDQGDAKFREMASHDTSTDAAEAIRRVGFQHGFADRNDNYWMGQGHYFYTGLPPEGGTIYGSDTVKAAIKLKNPLYMDPAGGEFDKVYMEAERRARIQVQADMEIDDPPEAGEPALEDIADFVPDVALEWGYDGSVTDWGVEGDGFVEGVNKVVVVFDPEAIAVIR